MLNWPTFTSTSKSWRVGGVDVAFGAWSMERGAIDASNSVASVALPLFNFYFTFIWLLVWFFFLLVFVVFKRYYLPIFPFVVFPFCPLSLFTILCCAHTFRKHYKKTRKKNQLDSAPKKIVVQSQCLSGCSSLSDWVGVGKKNKKTWEEKQRWETGKRASGLAGKRANG